MKLLALRALLLHCLFALFILLPSLSVAQSSIEMSLEQEATANSIFEEVLSPFCPGRLLRDCPSGQAHELKDSVKLRIKKGESREAIVESLYALYGDDKRSTPPLRGFGLFAWYTPFIFLLLGFVLIAAWLQIKSRQKSAEDGASPELDQASIDRIKSELNR